MSVKKKSGLGKGIDSIFIDNSIENDNKVSTLRISQIEPRSSQPRKSFESESLSQLADSISTHGVLQPIIVRESENGMYQIIAGERRWRASKMAGLTEMPVIVIDSDNEKTAQIALVENLQRENLNALEEAQAYLALMNDFGFTQEKLSEKIGKSRSAIANMLRLLDLPDEVTDLLSKGLISAGHARALLGLKYSEDAVLLAKKIAAEGLSVRATELAVKKFNRAAANEDKPVAEPPLVDYVKDLEERSMESLGRRVKICNSGKAKHVQIYYENEEDLETILIKLCGKKIIEQ